MLENSPDSYMSGEEEYSSSSYSESSTDEESNAPCPMPMPLPLPKEENQTKEDILGRAHRSILEELIDDAVLDVVFEVHRNIKIGHLLVENTERSCKPQHIVCPICRLSKGASGFASHLDTCMRGFRRKATQKIVSFKEDSNSDSQDSGSEEHNSRNPKKKKGSKKNLSRGSKLQGNSVSKQSPSSDYSTFQLMPQERKIAFFDKNCGVVSKRTKKLCTKSRNCPQHTQEEKKEVRNELLIEQINNTEVIDVDTIDGDISEPYPMPSHLPDN